jgi:transaldolase
MKSGFENLNIKIFADGADIATMKEMNDETWIKGLTTNPTLMRKSGITNYKNFAQKVLEFVQEKPISFEVFSDDLQEMKKQAYEIASWGPNVFVKIPITNTKGVYTTSIIKELSTNGVQLNVTAVMTVGQVNEIASNLNSTVPSYVSIFAGRVADTGVDPSKIVSESLAILRSNQRSEVIWASPRELLNVFQAAELGCHVITASTDILNKMKLIGYDLETYSLETVKMFYDDSQAAGFTL